MKNSSNKLKPNSEFLNSDYSEIDFKKLVSFTFRNKLLIILITFISSLIPILKTAFEERIYIGEFQIVVGQKEETKLRGINSSLISTFSKDTTSTKTQAFILNSPSVLKPVFDKLEKQEREFFKEDQISYTKWKKALKINFEPGTKVLTIQYKNKDKSLILKTLNLISNKYKSYSTLNEKKKLEKTLNFYNTQQKTYQKKTEISLKNLNEFTIANGLGDIDGFVDIGQNGYSSDPIFKNIELSSLNFNLKDDNSNKKSNNASQRYANQFALLQKYEANYLDLSSKLKPESQLLKELELKILNLRSSLKRPNEILIKFRELDKSHKRNDSVLRGIEENLEITKLEIARQKDPWELISLPTIRDDLILPDKKRIYVISLLASFIFAVILTYLKEKKSGIIFESDYLKENIKINYLKTINSKNTSLNKKIFINYLNSIDKSKNKSNKNNLCLIEFNEIKLKNETLPDGIKLIKFTNEIDWDAYEKYAFLLSKGAITKKQIVLINQIIDAYDEKIIGWFLLDSSIIF